MSRRSRTNAHSLKPRACRFPRIRAVALVAILGIIAWSVDPIASRELDAKASPNSQVPVVDQWSDTTQVFRNPDGSESATIGASSIQARDPHSPSGWSPIDTTLEISGDSVQPQLVDGSLSLSNGGTAPLATMEFEGVTFSISWPTSLPAPTLDGDSATYAEVLPATDLVVRAQAQGFEESLIIDTPPTEPLVIDLPITVEGATATLNDDGTVLLTDSRAIVEGTIPAPRDVGLGHRPGHRGADQVRDCPHFADHLRQRDPDAGAPSRPSLLLRPGGHVSGYP